MRCQCTTGKGLQCLRNSKSGRYCFQHLACSNVFGSRHEKSHRQIPEHKDKINVLYLCADEETASLSIPLMHELTGTAETNTYFMGMSLKHNLPFKCNSSIGILRFDPPAPFNKVCQYMDESFDVIATEHCPILLAGIHDESVQLLIKLLKHGGKFYTHYKFAVIPRELIRLPDATYTVLTPRGPSVHEIYCYQRR